MPSYSDKTNRLDLPYIQPAQAQKHVTHNEAIKRLDTIVQLSVKSNSLASKPTEPAEGDIYIVPDNPDGSWEHAASTIAAFNDNVWQAYTPLVGWRAWVEDAQTFLIFDQGAWLEISSSNTAPNQLGVNATADSTNRLTVASESVLLTHDGAGHQLKINKNATTDTGSVLFQTNFTGHAEFGLTGNNDWHVKTSPDGQIWQDTLIADNQTGQVSFPNGIKDAVSSAPILSLIPVSAGTGINSIYRIDTPRAQNPRTATINSISNNIITIDTPDTAAIFHPIQMSGVVYLRVWNTSKTPLESAWIMHSPTDTTLEVTNNAHIAGWQAGEALSFGDPTSVTPGRVMALDISPMMAAQYGAVFQQKAFLAKVTISGSNGVAASLGLTPSGAGGSFTNLSTFPDGTANSAQILSTCSELSPISNSNLVFIRETCSATDALQTTLVSIIGLYV